MSLPSRSVLSLVLAFLMFAPAHSQAQDRDAQLRKTLGVSADTPIKVSLKPALPTTTPLKVTLAFGLDASVTKNFIRWVEQWNKSGDAKKYGAIELVDEVAAAEVVIVRFVDRGTSAGTNTSGKVTDYGFVASGNSSSSAMIPVFAYILNRKESGYEVVGGYEDATTMVSSPIAGQSLWLEMRTLMKGRPKLK